MQLVDRLIKNGSFREEDRIMLAEAQAGAPTKAVHELLIEKGFVKEELVLGALAEEFGLELVDLAKVKIEADTLKSMPLKLVHRKAIMPISRNNGTLTVATGDPYDVYTLDELQTYTGFKIQPVLASPREIQRLIKTHFGVGGETVTALVQERPKDDVELLEDIEADDSEMAKMAQEASVVKLVNEILIEAANEPPRAIFTSSRRKNRSASGTASTAVSCSRRCCTPEITQFSGGHHQPYQNHGGVRLNIAEKPPAAGRPHQDARPGPRSRRARFDHPDDPRRRHRHAFARQGPHGL